MATDLQSSEVDYSPSDESGLIAATVVNSRGISPTWTESCSEEQGGIRSPFDPAGLLDRCLGNQALAQRVLDKFERTFAADLEELRHQIRLGDADAAQRVAHRLKGSAANVSAAELARLSSQLEQLAHAQLLATLPNLVQQLYGEWHRFLEFRHQRL